MALGVFTARGSSSTNATTSPVAAPGANQRIYIYRIMIMVSVAGTTSQVRFNDGSGGAVLWRAATTTVDSSPSTDLNPREVGNDFGGVPLSENTALSMTTSGGAAATFDYEIIYEVRGGAYA